MKTTVELITTAATVSRLLPGRHSKHQVSRHASALGHHPRGPVFAEFPVDPTACTTELGRWLAETVCTTRGDDDFSRLSLTLRVSEEDLHVRDAFERFGRHSIRTQADFERFHAQMQAWLAERKKTVKVFGGNSFKLRVSDYRWPVFGAGTSADSTTPESYFDVCAGNIQALQPVSARHVASGLQVPASMGLTHQ